MPGRKKNTNSDQVHTTIPPGMVDEINYFVLERELYKSVSEFVRSAIREELARLRNQEYGSLSLRNTDSRNQRG